MSETPSSAEETHKTSRRGEPQSSSSAAPSGAIDTPEEAEAARHAYDPSKYDRPSVTVDILIFTVRRNRLEVLLVRRRHWPFEGMWAIPGGFVNPEEDLETAARRELREETNVTDVAVEQVHTFGAPHRDPRTRTISVAYFAFVPPGTSSQAGDDAAETRWFPMDDLPPLAFDHADILGYTRSALHERLGCAPMGQVLLPKAFPLRDYLRVAEAIVGREVDRAAVRKRLLASGILKRVGQTAGAHSLYRFTQSADHGGE